MCDDGWRVWATSSDRERSRQDHCVPITTRSRDAPAPSPLPLCAALFLSPAPAQPGPTERVPQFENDQVKVWKSIVMPKAPLALHRHDHPRVIIALVGGTMQIVTQAGATETHPWESGKAYWLPANARANCTAT